MGDQKTTWAFKGPETQDVFAVYRYMVSGTKEGLALNAHTDARKGVSSLQKCALYYLWHDHKMEQNKTR